MHTHLLPHTTLPKFIEHFFKSPQTDIEITREEDFARILQMEEEYIQQICEDIIRLKPDLVFTEKGISGTHIHSCSAKCLLIYYYYFFAMIHTTSFLM